MIVAPENFRDEELLEPKEVLEDEGFSVTIASKETNSAKGAYGAVVTVDLDLGEVSTDDYDAVVFVGGSGSSVYFENENTHQIARDAYESGKIVAAICIAPSILANAGLLKDRKATCFSSQKEHLTEMGAEYTGASVEQDGRIITANGPEAATEFGHKIAKALE